MKTVSFYDMAPGAIAKLKEHFPAHRARLDEFHARGVLIAAGPLGNPPESAMGILTSREAAEEFIKSDPGAYSNGTLHSCERVVGTSYASLHKLRG
jgi:uncharacterized protein YciI